MAIYTCAQAGIRTLTWKHTYMYYMYNHTDLNRSHHLHLLMLHTSIESQHTMTRSPFINQVQRKKKSPWLLFMFGYSKTELRGKHLLSSTTIIIIIIIIISTAHKWKWSCCFFSVSPPAASLVPLGCRQRHSRVEAEASQVLLQGRGRLLRWHKIRRPSLERVLWKIVFMSCGFWRNAHLELTRRLLGGPKSIGLSLSQKKRTNSRLSCSFIQCDTQSAGWKDCE